MWYLKENFVVSGSNFIANLLRLRKIFRNSHEKLVEKLRAHFGAEHVPRDSGLRYPDIVSSLLEIEEILALEPESAKALREFNNLVTIAKNTLLFTDGTLRKPHARAEEVRRYGESKEGGKEVKTEGETDKPESDCASSPDKPS